MFYQNDKNPKKKSEQQNKNQSNNWNTHRQHRHGGRKESRIYFYSVRDAALSFEVSQSLKVDK